MKRFILLMLISVMFLACSMQVAQAEPLIRAELIREEPINVIRYIEAQIEYLAEIIARLWKTGKPVLLFGYASGVEVTLLEDFPKYRFNIVGGVANTKEDINKFFWGIEYELFLTGETYKIFKRLRPAIYVCEGIIYWGMSFELRPPAESEINNT